MDPDKLRRLHAAIEADRKAGASDREINRAVARNANIPFHTLTDVERAFAALPPARTPPSNPLDVLAPAFHGASFGAAGDLAELASRLEGRRGGGQRFQQALHQTRGEHPLLSVGEEITGALAGLPLLTGKLGRKALIEPLGRLGESAANRVATSTAAGGLGRVGAQIAGRNAGRTVGGALLGAGEGAAFGAGSQTGQPLSTRTTAAKGGAVIGGLLGGPTEGLLSGVQSFRALNAARNDAGPQLLALGRQASQDLPTFRGVMSALDETEAAKRAGFDAAGAVGTDLPGRATDILASDNVIVRKVLRKAARDGNPEAIKFEAALKRVRLTKRLRSLTKSGAEGAEIRRAQRALAKAGGPLNSLPAVSFDLADSVNKGILDRANGIINKGAKADLGATKEARRLHDNLTEALSGVESFSAARAASSLEGRVNRAFHSGQKAYKRSADEFERIFSGKKLRNVPKKLRTVVHQTPEELQAFRGGAATQIANRLEGGASRANSYIEKLLSSPQEQRKLRIILGGDKPFQAFLREAERLRAVGQAGRIGSLFLKAAGFFGAGSSIVGSVAAESL